MDVSVDDVDLVVNAVRAVLGVAVLGFAAFKDWKVREVEDEAWMVMEVAGLALIIINLLMWGSSIIHFVFLLPIFTACAYAFWGSPEIEEIKKGSKVDMAWALVYLASIVVFGYYIFQEIYKPDSVSDEAMMLFPMACVIILYYIMYYANLGGIHLLHGGADAKGMIAISVLLPVYPVFGSLPLLSAMSDSYLDIFVPFSFSVLMNAAWIPVLFYILYFPLRNIVQGSFGIPMFFGYTMPIDNVNDSHVWLMQRCDSEMNQRVVLLPSKLGEHDKDLKRLKKLGEKKVWVTPKIPFMIPILIGVVLMLIFGNLLVEALWIVRNAITGA
jgi:preflagellin peptidase FlaK